FPTSLGSSDSQVCEFGLTPSSRSRLRLCVSLPVCATPDRQAGRYIAGPMPPARLFVISAPSGAGKTSLVKALLDRLPGLRVSISHTTRPTRPNWRNGREYYFVDNAQFDHLKAAGAFLEH